VVDIATFEKILDAVESGHNLADILRALLMADLRLTLNGFSEK
jgi:hypothetical protein